AGVNTENRAGRVALLEPIMCMREDCVEFLCLYGDADPTLTDSDGVAPMSLARMFPKIQLIFSKRLKRKAFLNKRVKLHDLKGADDAAGTLNGSEGTVLRYDPSDQRFHIQLDNDEKRMLSIKEENLELIEKLQECAAKGCKNFRDSSVKCPRCLVTIYCSDSCRRLTGRNTNRF
ncbi:unnamed protein product, partial [Didymodactylos carnosus]